jgi:hypothetical protein
MEKTNQTFVKAELVKEIPGYAIGARFILEMSNPIIVWKTIDGINHHSRLGLPYDPKFFKQIKTVEIEKGYYRVKSKTKGNDCHPNHILQVFDNQSLPSIHGLVKLRNNTMGKMTEVKFCELIHITVYTFINSSGIISYDYFERDHQLYYLRVGLGIAGSEQEMREKLKTLKSQIA